MGPVHPALTLAIYALAVARGTVLVTEDRITEAPRAWALERLRERHWREFRRLAATGREHIARGESMPSDLAAAIDAEAKRATDAEGKDYLSYLLTCQWCASMWIGGLAAFVWWNWPTAWWSLGVAIAFAFSMITGKLSQIGG